MKTRDKLKILIVDDDPKMVEIMKDILSEEGYEVNGAGTVRLAGKELKKKFYNVVLVDLKLPDGSGLKLLKKIKKINDEIMIIVFTGFASLESSVFALNEGAFAYIQKPLNMDEVKIFIKKALRMQKLSLENKNLLSKLEDFSLKDSHTGLYNYRYLMERLASELKLARRYVLPLSVIMMDIDYFKAFNDVYGHQYGDFVLKELAQYLVKFSRGSDIVFRYGGEEFIILLPDTNKQGAVMFGERLLDRIKQHIFDLEGKEIKLKISMGIASFPEDGVETTADLIGAVDKALTHAKETGGNRFCPYKKPGKKGTKTIVKGSEKENINKVKEKLFKMAKRGEGSLVESIYTFAKVVRARDYHRGKNKEDLVSVVIKIGEKLNLCCEEIENLKHAVVLHDLGKIGISNKILGKRKKLTGIEYKRIKKHPQIGAEIIRPIHFLNGIIPIILYHHERFDGLGYSAGLRAEEIPLGARIIAVVDVYQALTADRPYRKAYNRKEALEIISEGSGTQFDPKIVEIFIAIMRGKKK